MSLRRHMCNELRIMEKSEFLKAKKNKFSRRNKKLCGFLRSFDVRRTKNPFLQQA